MEKAVEPVGKRATTMRSSALAQRALLCRDISPKAATKAMAAVPLRQLARQRRRQRRGAAGLRHVLGRPAISRSRRAPTNTSLGNFRADPAANKLTTPSGKIELYSGEDRGLRLRRLPAASDLDRAVGMARRQGREDLSAASRLEPAARPAAQPDGLRPGQRRRQGRGPRGDHDQSGGRKARGISAGDVVRVHNARLACLAGAIVSDTVSAGVVKLSCGAWYDPADGGEQALCLHGNANVLTRDQGTSKLGQGPSSATALVEVERWNEPLLPVAAFDPPRVAVRFKTDAVLSDDRATASLARAGSAGGEIAERAESIAVGSNLLFRNVHPHPAAR